MTTQTQLLSANDLPLFIELVQLFSEVFAMQDFHLPEPMHLQHLLEQEDFMAVVALQDGIVVGGLTAYTLVQYYSVQPLAYIYDLAVRSTMQRRGIGKALIHTLCNICRERGYEEVFVQADRVDEHAVCFYRSTGAIEEDVLHYYYRL